jgi:hypothetical protein
MDEDKLFRVIRARQMFDPPYDGPIAVAGRPISMIPHTEKKYRNFLEWWFEVGRLTPDDPQDWSTVSGPWVMRGREEAISAEDWVGLPESEKELIRSWAESLPIGMFYD